MTKINYALITSYGRKIKVYHIPKTALPTAQLLADAEYWWVATKCGLYANAAVGDDFTFGTPPSNLRLCGNCARVKRCDND